jgi:iron complex transport system substrate-binding protein
VYMVPKAPQSWMDRPPGVNQIIGIPWMAKVLYPDQFQSIGLKSMTKEFYSEFYHYNLTDAEASGILSSSGLKGY